MEQLDLKTRDFFPAYIRRCCRGKCSRCPEALKQFAQYCDRLVCNLIYNSPKQKRSKNVSERFADYRAMTLQAKRIDALDLGK